MLLKEEGDLGPIQSMAIHTDVEGLEATKSEVAVKGGGDSTHGVLKVLETLLDLVGTTADHS